MTLKVLKYPLFKSFVQSSVEGSGAVEEEKEDVVPVTVTPPAGATSEVVDLTQRLSILQSKRVEDKARIKELEKFKAHYLQVSVPAVFMHMSCNITLSCLLKIDLCSRSLSFSHSLSLSLSLDDGVQAEVE